MAVGNHHVTQFGMDAVLLTARRNNTTLLEFCLGSTIHFPVIGLNVVMISRSGWTYIAHVALRVTVACTTGRFLLTLTVYGRSNCVKMAPWPVRDRPLSPTNWSVSITSATPVYRWKLFVFDSTDIAAKSL
jgi:hypothetical protein